MIIDKSTDIELASADGERTGTAEIQQAKRVWVKPEIRSYDIVGVTEASLFGSGDGFNNRS